MAAFLMAVSGAFRSGPLGADAVFLGLAVPLVIELTLAASASMIALSVGFLALDIVVLLSV
jgi:hypothetical protein